MPFRSKKIEHKILSLSLSFTLSRRISRALSRALSRSSDRTRFGREHQQRGEKEDLLLFVDREDERNFSLILRLELRRARELFT